MYIKVNRNRIYDEMELVVVLHSAANTGVVYRVRCRTRC